MTGDELRRLIELRPVLTNVIGFHDLLYSDDGLAKQRFIYEAYFAANAVILARELHEFINDAIDRTAGP